MGSVVRLIKEKDLIGHTTNQQKIVFAKKPPTNVPVDFQLFGEHVDEKTLEIFTATLKRCANVWVICEKEQFSRLFHYFSKRFDHKIIITNTLCSKKYKSSMILMEESG